MKKQKIKEVEFKYTLKCKDGFFKESKEGVVQIEGVTQYEVHKNAIEWLFTEAIMKGEILMKVEIKIKEKEEEEKSEFKSAGETSGFDMRGLK